jgi:hypothetical protein
VATNEKKTQLGAFYFQEMGEKKNPRKVCDFKKKNLPFFEIKIIKLATSRPMHFLGRHLQQHFWQNAIVYLGQSPFNAN